MDIFQAKFLYASFKMLLVTKLQHMNVINPKGKLYIRFVTIPELLKAKLFLHPWDTVRILEGFLAILCVLSPTVLYGDTWKHLIYNFKKKEDTGSPAAVLMNSAGVANFAMNLHYFLLPSSRV